MLPFGSQGWLVDLSTIRCQIQYKDIKKWKQD